MLVKKAILYRLNVPFDGTHGKPTNQTVVREYFPPDSALYVNVLAHCVTQAA